ncbi:hypothetical protein SS50377_23379 [Spironucleus salmonicida]|uniref:Uncharacterized protein n=1 Tax=Spironucleus salmonicida TaxID=348837 RepID=V6LU75_9EUKA|nr:hypothetical protein SS50377_23379 [Spironucleus salmonicida]|eukprot:EST47251.1 Hypothetical protein SS50377_12761 [Spironucleus salmonicida]
MFEYTLRHNFTKKQRYDSFLSSELISTDQNDIYYFDQSKFAVNKFTLPENISKDCNQWDLIPVELKFEQILSDITDVLKIKVYKNFLYFVTLTSFNTYDLDTKSLKSISLMYGEWNFTILAEKIFLYSQTLNIFNVVQQNKAELDFISLPSSPINILQVNEQIIIVFSQFFAIYSIQLNLLKQIPVPAKVDVVAAQMNECHLILASKQRQILKVSIEGKVLGTIQAATKYDPQQIFFIDDSIILQSRSHEVIRQSFTQKNDRFSGVRGDAPWVGGEISQGTFVGLTEGGIYIIFGVKNL